LLATLKGNFDYGIRHPLGKIVNTLFLPLFGIFILFYGLLSEQSRISSILQHKYFVVLGKSSYIFYLIHMGIFPAALSKIGIDSTIPCGYFVVFVVLNIISIILFRYVEEPLNIYIRRFNGQPLTVA
jgi:peptidoglycan/LPS O-acetylase OafA/YrhL